jgi:hypothetical protein
MLNHDYKDMLHVLETCDVEYMLVGAYALAAHGYPRSTLDIDIWVNPTATNSVKVYRALAEFGAPLDEITEKTFEQRGIIFQVGIAPCRIDFITELSGHIEFVEAKERSVRTEIEGLVIHILSIDDLIRNKEAAGRPKDIEDAKRLRKKMREP